MSMQCNLLFKEEDDNKDPAKEPTHFSEFDPKTMKVCLICE